MTNKQALELAILDYELYLKTNENNKWVKKVLKGLKEVKQDLERLEKLEKENKKLKKAIEILKEKVDFSLYSKDDYFKRTMILTDEIFEDLTQEEYELLKEVLENEG